MNAPHKKRPAQGVSAGSLEELCLKRPVGQQAPQRDHGLRERATLHDVAERFPLCVLTARHTRPVPCSWAGFVLVR